MRTVYLFKEIYAEDRMYENSYLVVEDGKFVDILTSVDEKVIDFSDKIAIPGIIDIHSHGCMGYSATTTDQNEVYGYTKAIASLGVTGVYATTQELDTMECVANVIDSNEVKGARILGIQAEGPYRHPKYMGASKGFIWPKPSVEYTQKMLDAAKGHLKYISVSTDIDDIEPVIQYLLENGVRIAAGHTDCGYHEMNDAFKLGITSITHFGNAMKPIHQRDGGTVAAGLLNKSIYIELITDHIHVKPEVLEIYLKVKNHDHIMLISDSSELAYMPKGRYFARGKERIVTEDGRIVLDDGTISGSGKSILYDMKVLVREHHLSKEEVIKMASLNPATYFNLQDKKGSIKVGKDADFVVMDSDWNVHKTFVEGNIQYDSEIDLNLYNQKMNNLLENE